VVAWRRHLIDFIVTSGTGIFANVCGSADAGTTADVGQSSGAALTPHGSYEFGGGLPMGTIRARGRAP